MAGPLTEHRDLQPLQDADDDNGHEDDDSPEADDRRRMTMAVNTIRGILRVKLLAASLINLGIEFKAAPVDVETWTWTFHVSDAHSIDLLNAMARADELMVTAPQGMVWLEGCAAWLQYDKESGRWRHVAEVAE